MTLRSFHLVCSAALLFCFGAAAQEDEGPGHGVARVSLMNGEVSICRGDNGDWVAAAINAPLVVLDHVATGAASRAEVQLDRANRLRLDSTTEVRLAEIEDRSIQVDLARGVVTLSVLGDSPVEMRVNTPSVSMRPLRQGSYRIFVRDDGQSEITVRAGEASIDSQAGAQNLRPGQTMLVRGDSNAPEFQIVAAAGGDEWDRWNDQRDRELERSQTYKYVNRDIYGAEDLDAHGRWVNVSPYGWVWAPAVGPGWAPYREGRWVWVDFYGWTWVSTESWGWAPYHYGSWFHRAGYGWCWFPGPRTVRPVWRPAMVAFIGFGGGGGVQAGVSFGSVGWVPLAPYEPYHPWYGRGRTTVVNNVTVVNVTSYQNTRVVNAVSAVNVQDFGRGRVITTQTITTTQIQRATVVRGGLPVTPTRESIRVSDREVRVANLPRANTQRFYTPRQPVHVERVPFGQQPRDSQRVVNRPAAQPKATPATPQRGWRQSGSAPAAAAPPPATRAPAATAQPQRTNESGWRRTGVTPAPAQPSGASAPAPVQQRTNPQGWHRMSEQPSTANTGRTEKRDNREVQKKPERKAPENEKAKARERRAPEPQRQ
jgi:hypothetical protein